MMIRKTVGALLVIHALALASFASAASSNVNLALPSKANAGQHVLVNASVKKGAACALSTAKKGAQAGVTAPSVATTPFAQWSWKIPAQASSGTWTVGLLCSDPHVKSGVHRVASGRISIRSASHSGGSLMPGKGVHFSTFTRSAIGRGASAQCPGNFGAPLLAGGDWLGGRGWMSCRTGRTSSATPRPTRS